MVNVITNNNSQKTNTTPSHGTSIFCFNFVGFLV